MKEGRLGHMTITQHRSLANNSTSYVVEMDHILERLTPDLILSAIAVRVAEKYVAEHYQDIAELISQDAIATLSVAESAAKIRETLEKKMPDRVMEVVRTDREVWQRGLLGGMRRIG